MGPVSGIEPHGNQGTRPSTLQNLLNAVKRYGLDHTTTYLFNAGCAVTWFSVLFNIFLGNFSDSFGGVEKILFLSLAVISVRFWRTWITPLKDGDDLINSLPKGFSDPSLTEFNLDVIRYIFWAWIFLVTGPAVVLKGIVGIFGS